MKGRDNEWGRGGRVKSRGEIGVVLGGMGH
jgi:hypothetical protein